MDTPNSVMQVLQVLQDAGHQAFLVGGCVRDAIMGITPKDWDIASSATPAEVQTAFEKTIPTGIEHGTVTVVLDGEHVEVTTFRIDGASSDGRRPDSVEFAKTIEEDLSRRDFTCNAIAFDLINNRTVDPFGGNEDIASGVLNCVGSPTDRFNEDGLRILRALRFSVTKNFTLSQSVRDGIVETVNMLDSVSRERVRDELLKMLGGSSPNPSPVANNPNVLGQALNFMQESGVMVKVCPKLTKQVGLSQNRHHAWNVWEHTRCCVEGERTQNPIVRLAVLLHDIAKPATRNPHPSPDRAGDFQFLTHEELGAEMAESWMREFKFSNDEIDLVVHCIRHHLIFFEPSWTDRQLRRWLRKVGDKHLNELLEVRRADIVGKKPDVSRELEEQELLRSRIVEVSKDVPHSTSHLALRGNDIITILNLKKGGKIVGQVLNELLNAVTENPDLNNCESLTSIVERFAQGNENND